MQHYYHDITRKQVWYYYYHDITIKQVWYYYHDITIKQIWYSYHDITIKQKWYYYHDITIKQNIIRLSSSISVFPYLWICICRNSNLSTSPPDIVMTTDPVSVITKCQDLSSELYGAQLYCIYNTANIRTNKILYLIIPYMNTDRAQQFCILD